ncbi:MAG: AbrB/MazE/SpoVT family DNA-binding domain-containing protein [Actinomycetota bacterium]
MDVAATVTSKGQITLPKSVRRALGLTTGGRVGFRVEAGRAVLARTEDLLDLAGSVPVPGETRGLKQCEVRRHARARAAARRYAPSSTRTS